MAWKPLSERFATLPLILAGPILRRTESTNVSVWVAFKYDVTDIKLKIFNGSRLILESAPTSTISIGRNLHVALITADQLVDPSICLVANVIYSYNLVLGSRGNVDLAAPGILSAQGSTWGEIEKITYGNFTLPTFVLPADDINDLRIIHGSCRKPHGGKTDALRALDVMIDATHNDPRNRPQQLYFTGDQIYADECNDVMLFMANDAEHTLLDIIEVLPGNISPDDLLPGRRQDTMDSMGFTSVAARSHLIKLSEFYLSYMFVWSEELWDSSFPEFEKVYHGQQHITEMKLGTSREVIDNYIEKYGTLSPYVETMLSTHGLYYHQKIKQLTAFKNSLSFVRRALANIPSYMMFDDHEITDDWFLTFSWTKKILADEENNTARRVIQNGLAAFAVFQAWGNTPDRFKPGTRGGDLLHLLKERPTHPFPTDWINIGIKLLPELLVNGTASGYLGNGFDWHFSIEFNAFQLIFLDTRTRRAFHSKNGPPTLINNLALLVQLPTRSQQKKLTMLISPVPVFGNNRVEELQHAKNIVLTTLGSKSQPASLDFEAWIFKTTAFENLLAQLVKYERLVILSGDVHYAFSNATQYWDHRTSITKRAVFAQLCSSSLANMDGMTLKSGEWNNALGVDKETYVIGWDSPGLCASYHTKPSNFWGKIEIKLSLNEAPYFYSYNKDEQEIDQFHKNPKWRCKIVYGEDNRSKTDRNVPDIGTLPNNLKQRWVKIKNHNKKWDNNRIVVGRDNIGEISFEWGTVKKVKHVLWYETADEDRYILLPLTKHELILDPPMDDTTAPGGVF